MDNHLVPTTHLKDLEGLLREHVKENIVRHSVEPLTEFGENFGSEILRVEVTIEENGEEKQIHAVAKLIPLTDFQKEMFNTQVTFKNEIGFYAEIIPALEALQKEHKIEEVADFFPKLYGARISLNPENHVVDEDAVILMENLKLSGFDTLERHQGFDLNTTKLVLRALANFQATCIALKLQKPDVFNTNVKPYLEEWKVVPFPFDHDNVFQENPKTVGLIPRVNRIINKRRVKKVKEPWATVTHNDLWVNNIMFKYENDEVTDLRFVDFQMIDYGSIATDVIFLLFTSVNTSVLKYHFQKLLRYFYDQLIETFLRLKVDTRPFTWESFQDELAFESNYQVRHSLMMMFVVFGPKGMQKKPGRVPEWNPTGEVNGNLTVVALKHTGPPKAKSNKDETPPPPDDFVFKPSLEGKERIWFIAEESAKRKWI